MGAMVALAGTTLASQATYLNQMNTLAEGAMDTLQTSAGLVWLNVTGFAPAQLPHIQRDLGIYTYDNVEILKATASLAATAASQSNYGDLVYFFNAFAMNGHAPNVKVVSDEMREGLLAAVTPQGSNTPDQKLIQLYADTSSIPALREAFLSLKTMTLRRRSTPPPTSPNKRNVLWTKEACSNAHQALKSGCRKLISNIKFNATWVSGGPRSICQSGCCISWSTNATFQIQNLTNAADYCVQACGSVNVSCEVFGVSLQGTIVNECLSNRADGCK